MDSNLRCGLLDHTILWIIRSYGKLHPGLLSNFHWCHPLYSEAACLCMISVSYELTRSFSLLSWELMTHTVLRMMTSTRGITLSLDYTIVKTYWNFLYTCYCHIFLPERPRYSKILLHFLNKIQGQVFLSPSSLPWSKFVLAWVLFSNDQPGIISSLRTVLGTRSALEGNSDNFLDSHICKIPLLAVMLQGIPF